MQDEVRSRAVRYHRAGSPVEVVQIDEVNVAAPAANEVRLQMLFAPINPADLNMLEGKYGEARPLPDVPGNEGVGRVVAIGPGVPASWRNRLVLVDREAWRETGNWNVEGLIPVADGLELRQASMLRVNPPTAWRMLHDFVKLAPGDWVAQNAATSGVGRAVIEIARAMGCQTLNVVRRAEAAAELSALGADAVVVDGPEMAEQAKVLLGGTKPKLALNAVGGPSATRLAGLLATGGTMVTYGAMSKEALKIPNGFVIFRDMSFRGFWLTRWLRESTEEQRREMFGEIFRLAAAGCFRPRVGAEFALADVRPAVAEAVAGHAAGKVLLRLGA